nr:MAG TPA: PemK-like protein [Caudoviricetes sp.]
MEYDKPRLGDIYLMSFSGIDSEQKGVRPGIIFQNDIGNDRSPNVIALPLTTRIKNLTQPTHVLLPAEKYNLLADSLVLCENPQRMSKSRLLKYLGALEEEDIKSIAIGNILSSSAIALLSEEELLDVWKESKRIQGL